MSYPPQRPPQQSFESASGNAPLLHAGYPAMPVPQHHPSSPGLPPDTSSPSPASSANKLRRPGWGKKDAEMGHYEELDRAHAGASAFDLGGPVVSIPDGGQQPKTKVRPLSDTARGPVCELMRVIMYLGSSARCIRTSSARPSSRAGSSSSCPSSGSSGSRASSA